MPAAFTIDHNNRLVSADQTDRDPRGFIWIYEPPSSKAAYVVGVDPSMGRTGWHRSLRTMDDTHIDNAAIEVIRVGSGKEKDVQVAEFAAPIDPYELARYVNLMGKLYCGNDENEQALCIIEVYPGPGFATQRELLEKYGYFNHFIHKTDLDSASPRETGYLGFTSTPKSVRDLWIKGIHHISNDRVRISSEVLVEEFANCKFDRQKMRGMAIGGRHDDRVSAFLFALWAAHDWTGQVDPEAARANDVEAKPVNWQAMDISAEDMNEEWEKLWDAWTDAD